MGRICRLNEDGYEKFVGYAEGVAISVSRSNYFHETGRPLGRGMTVSFQSFIEILDKYTDRRRSSVKLDATIICSNDQIENYLHIWGIKDTNVRNGIQSSRYLDSQTGVWTCKLEDALRKGIPSFGIEKFRENLCLTSNDDQILGSDDYFFSSPIEGV